MKMREPSKPRILTPAEINALLRQKTRANSIAREAVKKRGIKLHPRVAAAKAAQSSTLDEFKSLVAQCDPFQQDRSLRRPIIDTKTGRPLNEPALLLSLQRHDHSLALLFEGLRRHYFEAITTGRLDAWKKCGHAIVEFCGEVSEANITRRDEGYAGLPLHLHPNIRADH